MSRAQSVRLMFELGGLAVGLALFLLLLAPASWAMDTLGHATSGTFPAGGPANVAMDGPGGGGMPGGGTRFSPPGGTTGGFTPPGGTTGGFSPPTGQGTTQSPGGGFGGGAGGPFGSSGASLSSVVSYVNSHGGGTIAVDSQSGAAGSIIEGGAKVAGIGGFSGRESQVSIKWLAQAVQSGRIRWVLVSGTGGGGFQDGRIGASELMAAVQKVGTKVLTTNGGTLYDLSGKAAQLLAQA
jgi:hypothetical protein